MSDFEEDAVSLMVAAHREGVLRFIRWCETNWKHEPAEKWPHAEPYPGDDIAEGWNRAIASIKDAFDCYAEEFSIR